MKQKTWKEALAERVTELTGYHLGMDHIHPDTNWFWYISDLEDGRPLLIIHYKGPLCATMSSRDYNRLEKGEVTPEDYIQNSVWYFGYYAGYGGAFWFNFGETKGLHNDPRVLKYLEQQRELSAHWVGGAKITTDLSDYPKVPDGRVELFKKAKERVEALNCKIDFMRPRVSAGEEAILIVQLNNKLELGISSHFLNKALYYPDTLEQLKKEVETLPIYARIHGRDAEELGLNPDIGAWFEKQQQ